MKEIIIKEEELDKEKYFVTEYFLESETKLQDAALAIAIGQTLGNPELRATKWETKELIEKYTAKIIHNNNLNNKRGYVKIAFPICNLDWKEDGVSQLLVIIQGGHLDIKNIQKCYVVNIDFPKSINQFFFGPRLGLKELREKTNTYNKPLLMGICKPKLMQSPKMLLEMIKQLVEGGVNIIKLDEINSSPPSCQFDDRAPIIAEYLKNKPVIYFDCVTSDYPYIIERIKRAYNYGISGVHVNFWVGWGIYRTIRNLDLDMFLFCQRSGDKCMTDQSHRFHISWSFLCKLLAMSGVSVVHAGMFGGYSNDDPIEIKKAVNILRNFNVAPSLSCGFTSNLIENITNQIGVDYIIGAGGSIHSHPKGTIAGAYQFRQTINKLYG
ncbi:MAG: RuBisCO large subunit C-terminal-like domain-containing protein [Nanoarchaeota archaeon]